MEKNNPDKISHAKISSCFHFRVQNDNRKSSRGAHEIPRVSKVQWGGGGGVVAVLSMKSSVDSSKNYFFVRRLEQVITKIRRKRIFP